MFASSYNWSRGLGLTFVHTVPAFLPLNHHYVRMYVYPIRRGRTLYSKTWCKRESIAGGSVARGSAHSSWSFLRPLNSPAGMAESLFMWMYLRGRGIYNKCIHKYRHTPKACIRMYVSRTRKKDTHSNTHTSTHARMHARTHARTHTHTHTHTQAFPYMYSTFAKNWNASGWIDSIALSVKSLWRSEDHILHWHYHRH